MNVLILNIKKTILYRNVDYKLKNNYKCTLIMFLLFVSLT